MGRTKVAFVYLRCKERGLVAVKIAAAEDALDAVERAIEVYADEKALIESRQVLWVFLASTRAEIFFGRGEAAEMAGELESAVRKL
jgi:hypothetical protein